MNDTEGYGDGVPSLANIKLMFSELMKETKKDILEQVQGSISKVYEDLEPIDLDSEESMELGSVPESSQSLAKKLDSFVETTESTENNVKDESFKSLAEEFSVSEKTAPAINSGLADIINSLLEDKLPKDKISGLQDKYLKPANCINLVAPKINKQMWQQLHQETKNADSSFQKAQSLMMSGIYALLQQCNKAEGEQKSVLTHSIVLLLCANREFNLKRRDLIRPDLNKQYAALCNPSTPITNFLFGDDLNKEVEELTKSNKLSSRVTSKQRVEPYRTSRFKGNRTSYSQSYRGKGPKQQQASFLGAGRGRGRPQQATKPQQNKTQ